MGWGSYECINGTDKCRSGLIDVRVAWEDISVLECYRFWPWGHSDSSLMPVLHNTIVFHPQKCTQGSKKFLSESMKAFSLGMDEWMVSSDEEEEECCKRTPEALHLRTEINNGCLVQADDATFPSSPANQGRMHVAVSSLHAAQTQEGVSPSPPPSPIIGSRRTPDLSSLSPIPPEPSRASPVRSSSASLQQLKNQVSTSGVRPSLGVGSVC